MKRIHTHYDNLRIVPTDDANEIRIAYRRLCRRYHPDCAKNPQEAHRIMCLVNHSYAVLSDPKKKAQHDAWIAAQIQEQKPIARPMPNNAYPKKSKDSWWFWLVMLAAVLVVWLVGQHTENHRFSNPNITIISNDR